MRGGITRVGAFAVMLAASVFAGGFKGEVTPELKWSEPVVDDRGEAIGTVSFDYATFSYEFFSLMGSPCQLLAFDHAFKEITLELGEKSVLIRPTSGDEAVYRPQNEIFGHLFLPDADFERLRVMDFDYELTFTLGLNAVIFEDRFPGYIEGQRQGSFDVPAGKSWGEWARYRALASEERPFYDEKKAKAAFAVLQARHEDATRLHYPELRIASIQLNRFELYALAAKHGLSEQVFGAPGPGRPFEKILASFAKGEETPEEQLKAYETMKALAERMNLPAEFSRRVERVNRAWFNRYISARAPMNFSAESYADPAKMKNLLDYHREKNARWLAFSDLSFGFDFAMPVDFTVVATLERKYEPYYGGGISLTAQYSEPDMSGWSASKKRAYYDRKEREKEEAERRRRREKEEKERRAREKQRKVDAERARFSAPKEVKSETLYASIDFETAGDPDAVLAELERVFAERVADAKATLVLPELEYHEWKVKTKWNWSK